MCAHLKHVSPSLSLSPLSRRLPPTPHNPGTSVNPCRAGAHHAPGGPQAARWQRVLTPNTTMTTAFCLCPSLPTRLRAHQFSPRTPAARAPGLGASCTTWPGGARPVGAAGGLLFSLWFSSAPPQTTFSLFKLGQSKNNRRVRKSGQIGCSHLTRASRPFQRQPKISKVLSTRGTKEFSVVLRGPPWSSVGPRNSPWNSVGPRNSPWNSVGLLRKQTSSPWNSVARARSPWNSVLRGQVGSPWNSVPLFFLLFFLFFLFLFHFFVVVFIFSDFLFFIFLLLCCFSFVFFFCFFEFLQFFLCFSWFFFRRALVRP